MRWGGVGQPAGETENHLEGPRRHVSLPLGLGGDAHPCCKPCVYSVPPVAAGQDAFVCFGFTASHFLFFFQTGTRYVARCWPQIRDPR